MIECYFDKLKVYSIFQANSEDKGEVRKGLVDKFANPSVSVHTTAQPQANERKTVVP